MKRNICILTALFSMLFTIQVSAIPPEFAGGVNNEYEYREYVFLSGQPVLFKGTIKESDSGTADKKTISYTFALKPDDTSITGKLDRQTTYIVTGSKRDDKGQTIAQTALSKMKETVNIDGVVFDLKDYQFSKSDVIDNRPVSDYYSGNVNGRKYYTINKTEGTATVDISGGDVGYQNFWGSTDTLKLTNVITYNRKSSTGSTPTSTPTTSSAAATGGTSGATETSWHGTVEIVTSDSTTKTMDYSQNDASYSSFQGGYLKVTGREMLSTFNYDLPLMKSGVPDDTLRKKSVINLSNSMVPQIQRLVVPKFKDVSGHWAEEYIGKLYSLDVFDDTAQFFLPDVPMTRKDFTKAVMNACNIRPVVAKTKVAIRSAKNAPAETSVFKDVDMKSSDYSYIKDAVKKGIISGVTQDTFDPDGSLTKAQATAILVRALGLDSMAPAPGFSTSFDDDAHIGQWAKDYVYVAKETGLITGDNNNMFNPDATISRAEASALLSRFLEFLQKDLRKDYREDIMIFK